MTDINTISIVVQNYVEEVIRRLKDEGVIPRKQGKIADTPAIVNEYRIAPGKNCGKDVLNIPQGYVPLVEYRGKKEERAIDDAIRFFNILAGEASFSNETWGVWEDTIRSYYVLAAQTLSLIAETDKCLNCQRKGRIHDRFTRH